MTNKNKRIILVTGASRGVGKGIAEGIAQPNDIIICAARSLKKGTTVSQFGFDVKSSLQETVEGIEKKQDAKAKAVAKPKTGNPDPKKAAAKRVGELCRLADGTLAGAAVRKGAPVAKTRVVSGLNPVRNDARVGLHNGYWQ